MVKARMPQNFLLVTEKSQILPDLFTEFKVFRGTVVTSDEAVIEATQIGDNTVLGSINTSLQEDSKNSPSKEKLNKLARNIGVLGYSAGAAYSVINLVLGFIA